ncbi:hypothetical protein, partial [Nocardia sp. NPDC058497]|uniref:hypothetical protein n=1 Tax=Nocardia sp. NPDC058497 TaxID=3346529 RepID=UPI0036521222
ATVACSFVAYATAADRRDGRDPPLRGGTLLEVGSCGAGRAVMADLGSGVWRFRAGYADAVWLSGCLGEGELP